MKSYVYNSTGLGITLDGILKAQSLLKENGFDLPVIEILMQESPKSINQFAELIASKGAVVQIFDMINDFCGLSTVPAVRFRNEYGSLWICSDGDSIIINPDNTRLTRNLEKYMVGQNGNINKFLNIIRFGIENPTDYEKEFSKLFPKVISS